MRAGTRIRALLMACAALLYAIDATEAGQLRVGRVEPPPGLGIPFGSIGQPASSFWSAMFDGLTRMGAGGRLEPALALSWENDGDRRWLFRLRPGVTFQNGAPMTAASVAQSLGILQTERGRTLYVATEMAGVASLRALDELTLEVITAEPDPVLANRLSLVMLVEPQAWDDRGPEGFSRAPIGTGPFQLVSRAGASTKLRAYRQSWRPPADVDELEFVAIPEITARMPALQSGRIDVAEALNAVDIAAAAAGGDGIREVLDAPNAVLAMMFRTVGRETGPLSDVRVRRAINFAVDKTAIARDIVDGRMDVASQGLPTGMLGHDPALAPYPYEPARAKALLAEAGYQNGLTLRLEFVGAMPWEAAMYQKIAQDLAAVGIATEVTSMPFPVFLGKVASGQWGETDIFPLVWDSSVFGDASRTLRVASCLKPNPFFCDPALTPLIEAAATEMNPERRRRDLATAMAATHAAPPGVWLLDFRRFFAVGPRVASLPLRPTGIVYEAVTLTN